MKKLVAGALALALGFSAFAQDVHELVGSAGKISFGAWGRSTFNIGADNTKTKLEMTPNLSDNVYQGYVKGELEKTGTNAIKTAADEQIAKNTTMASYGITNLSQLLAACANPATAELAQQAYGQLIVGMAGDSGLRTAFVNEMKSGIATATGIKETDDSEVEWYASVAPDWSYGCRVGFWIIGRTNDERWGFDFNLDSDAAALFVGAQNYDSDLVTGKLKEKSNGLSYAESGKYAVAIGDQAKIWGIFDFNPIDLKVAFGKMREQELRGSIGDFGQRESSDVRSEDDIFTEMWPVMGLFVSAKGQEGTALEGLYAAVDCDAFGLVSAKDESKELKTKLSDLASTLQGGVGYTIPGIAQVKAQFIADSIEEGNKKYSKAKYADARAAGFGYKDYAGRFEFGIDWLGFAGGATGIGNVDLDKTPNANIIELGVKVPLMIDEDLRQYDPEKFYNFYTCLGTMGVIQKGFIFYKAHIWGGKGESNLQQYSKLDANAKTGALNFTGNAANIIMLGFDALAEVCLNPFGKQNNFAGLSFNYNITNAGADGLCNGKLFYVDGLKLQQHNFGIEVYLKHTFAANNYFFIGVADRLSIQKMDGTLDLRKSPAAAAMGADFSKADKAEIDLSYSKITNKVYIPVGVEMFF